MKVKLSELKNGDNVSIVNKKGVNGSYSLDAVTEIT